jgi:hypothetical protein
VKSAIPLDDSEAMFDEDMRHVTMSPAVLSIDTMYGTNREKRPLLVFAGTSQQRLWSSMIALIMTTECSTIGPSLAPQTTTIGPSRVLYDYIDLENLS